MKVLNDYKGNIDGTIRVSLEDAEIIAAALHDMYAFGEDDKARKLAEVFAGIVDRLHEREVD